VTIHTELLPCPFCGAPADDANPDGDMEGYSIRCSGKSAIFSADASCCPMHTFGYTKEEDAITAWNRRPEQPSEAAIRNAALEEAAAICEQQSELATTAPGSMRALSCADAIRALSTTPAEPTTGWVDSKTRMPTAGMLIVKRWRRNNAVWAGKYEGGEKWSSFDEWLELPESTVIEG